MSFLIPFCPARGSNQVLTANSSSQSITIDASSKSVRVVNSGTSNIAYVRLGSGDQTATTADTPILPSSSIILSKSDYNNTLAYISASGTTLNVQTGEGGI